MGCGSDSGTSCFDDFNVDPTPNEIQKVISIVLGYWSEKLEKKYGDAFERVELLDFDEDAFESSDAIRFDYQVEFNAPPSDAFPEIEDYIEDLDLGGVLDDIQKNDLFDPVNEFG